MNINSEKIRITKQNLTMKTKLFDISSEVEAALINDIKARDNDQRLCCMIWSKALSKQGVDIRNANIYTFLSLYSDDKMPLADSITRARRKVQELKPMLRGENYAKRQAHQENVIEQLELIEKSL